MVAFRNIVEEIPVESAVDEASIEAIIRQAGYKLYYDGNALVKNKGAETVTDFLKQRRRIYAGHLWLCKTQDYEVSTNNPFSIFKHLLHVMEWSPKKVLWSIGAISLEAWGRFLGMWDFYIKKKNPYKWEISESTKNLCQPES
jgi:cellulose synthase/poly-beta-1,6-N-acetylglucosamine synthase-like glycosyltransferase